MKNMSKNEARFTFKGFIIYWLKFWKVTLLVFVLGLIAGTAYTFSEVPSYKSDVKVSVYNPEYASGGVAVSPYSALTAILVSSESIDEVKRITGDDVDASMITVTESPRSIFNISVVDTDAEKSKRIANALADATDDIIKNLYSDGDKYEVSVISAASEAVSTITTLDRVISVVFGGLGAIVLVMLIVFIKFDLSASK